MTKKILGMLLIPASIAIIAVSVYAGVSGFINREVEAGVVSGGAESIADTTASGGQLVKFGSSVPGGGCETTVQFVPGGPDPWGGCWPGNNNTGVPAGTTLTNYTGPCTITANNTVINARTINCGPLVVRAANVTITNSLVNDGINIETAYCSTASLSISDSTIDLPISVSGGNSGSTGLLRCSYTANRVNVTGGRRSMYCANNCTVENSWVHAQGVDEVGGAHFSGIRMEQNGVFRHNSITCEATRAAEDSGCSAGLTGYPDFAPVQNNLIERNLFYRGGAGGSTVCAYGGATTGKPYSNDPANATNIRFISNRFVRGGNGYCGNVQTVIHYSSGRTGNQWTDNLFDTGVAVVPQGP